MESSDTSLPRNVDNSSIAAVERDTGLGKDTLRVWERRYGFPVPHRDANGERSYPPEQVERLRRIKRLMNLGWRPGKIFAASEQELEAWLAQKAPPASTDTPPPGLLELVRMPLSSALREALLQGLLKQGLERFVIDTIAPLNTAVGEAWMRGDIEVAEEHLYTEHVQNLLRNAMAQGSNDRHSPRILLTTVPDEAHGLGLLMAEALLVSNGAHCVSLGTRTPLADIIATMHSARFDVLALSFSASFAQRQAISHLQTLASELPAHCQIWAGGAGVAQRMPAISRVQLLGPIASVLDALQQWRDAARN